MHFSSTDLPVPEPPITTIDSPGRDLEVDALQHLLGSEGLGDAAQRDLRGAHQSAKKASVMK